MLDLVRKDSFRHGVHPPENKDETAGLAIRQFPFAPVLIVPLSQHLGKPARPVVREGQEVVRGQTIAEPDGFMSVAMHAPASGTVRRIGLAPGISGKMVESIYIEPLPASTQEIDDGVPCGLDATPDEIIEAIQRAGIVGLGGAAFPTHVKLKPPEGKHLHTLFINGVECEPFLTTDHRVMLEQTEDVFMGIRYLLRATGTSEAIIAVEANKPDAVEALRAACPDDIPVSVRVSPVKYPQGAEKMVISALLGKEVPSGGLPVDVGAICCNVATTAEIGRLLPRGRGIQERVITITGPGVANKGNYRIPIGTPVRFALEATGASGNISRVFMGGPMMGPSVSNLDIPITKGTSGITAFTTAETGGATGHKKVYPCIGCARCVESCPLFLNPSQLGILAKAEEYERMAEEFHLMDCFECGSCSFVCPSHIPLVQQFRLAKKMVRKLQAAQ
ncbi:MAG: electron transport complex subunit RsxC [Xanthomonadales bacterium]|nr:electron transport complex subunit RsxC [Xanthomonadales bacterium]NIX13723.1 electron transport complex subunit RsxC [Xanthomonadales bacterium]